MRVTEQEIFRKCVENLRSLQPVQSVSVLNQPEKEIHGKAVIKIRFKNTHCQFNVEIKPLLKRPLPAYLYTQAKLDIRPVIIISAYINSSIAQDLKKNGIQYIDVPGNTHLKLGEDVYIEIDGKKPDVKIRPESASLFQPKLMQLLSIFLIDPASVNQTVRKLADRAGISKERVSTGLRLLKKDGWLLQTDAQNYKLVNRKTLFERWLMNYGERLRSKLVLGSYKIAPSIEKNLELKINDIFKNLTNNYAFTGGLGAQKLIHFYRGETTEIFIPGAMLHSVQESLKLIRSKEPNTTLFNLFSPNIVFQSTNTAHPIFIYAELMYHGGDREQETARIIYKQFLQDKIE